MSLSNLAALGSFVSGIAVVVSFVFLAAQIRQANRNQRSQMQQGRSGRLVEILLRMTDPEMSRILVRALKVDPTLDDAEIFAFYFFAASMFWGYEDSFLQFRAKTIDRESWETDLTSLRNFLTAPPYCTAWRLARMSMAPDYRAAIDDLVREAETRPQRFLPDLWRATLAEEMKKREARSA
jgi:hypothetical protein